MKSFSVYMLGGLGLVAVAALLWQGPIAQDPVYHDYADQRVLLGIPYFWNVVSNAPMFFIGLYGWWYTFARLRPQGTARLILCTLFAGVFFTSFGSAYYHWAPDNHTLLWDRLPMTLMFMSLFSLFIFDFYGEKAGQLTFWATIPLGVFSVLYWHFTEAAGQGDLRPYAMVQFFPMVAAPALILSNRGKVPYVRPLAFLLGWYMLAKVCEHYDHQVYALSGFWSGHTFKHFFGAVGLLYAVQLVGLSPACRTR